MPVRRDMFVGVVDVAVNSSKADKTLARSPPCFYEKEGAGSMRPADERGACAANSAGAAQQVQVQKNAGSSPVMGLFDHTAH